MSKLDNLIETFLVSHDSYKFRAQKASYNYGDVEHAQAKWAIKQWALELVGEDELLPIPPEVYDEFEVGKLKHFMHSRAIGRNELRAELRKKVEEL